MYTFDNLKLVINKELHQNYLPVSVEYKLKILQLIESLKVGGTSAAAWLTVCRI